MKSVTSSYILLLLLSGWSLLVAADEVCSNTVTEETLAAGTPFGTPVFVRETGIAGPVILLTGGMHGNEPAGAAAADQIRQWNLLRGTLICVPRTNPPALAAVKRYTPGAIKAEKNLNRNFVVADGSVQLRGVMANQLWKLVEQFQPDWVIDLHEGFDFNRINSKSVGSSVIANRSDATQAIARKMIAAVDAEISDEQKKFGLRGPPIAGSLTRAAIEVPKIPAMILETTSKNQSLAKRCRQHRLMVATFLHALEMVADTSIADELVPPSERPLLNVALYDDSGVAGKGIPSLSKLWGKHERVTIDRISGADIRAGVLDQFDVICCSGGSGSAQSKSLGEAGRAEVSEFVESGGDYVGICAGSYLACSGFSWGLGILDAKTKSNKWRRGRATLKITITDVGDELFDAPSGTLDVLYANGPIIEPHNQPEINDYVTLATFADEVSNHGSPKGIMVESPAIVKGLFGTGSVICISPHPEQTAGANVLIEQLLQYLDERQQNGT